MNGIRAPASAVADQMKHTDEEKGAFMNSLDFDLQLFAGGEGGADGAAGGEGNAPAGASDAGGGDKLKDTPPQGKPEDVQAKIDAAVAAAKAKWEKDYQKKAEAEKKEKERLSKLSGDERKAAELENNRKELEAKEAELKKKELKLEMVNVLADRSIPVQFMDYLLAEDNESTMKRITTFEKEFKKAVEAGVNEKLKGKVPVAGASGAAGASGGAGVTNGFFDAIYKNQVKR